MSTPQPREMIHFLLLSPDEQREAIRKMVKSGWSVHTIAAATKISIEQIRLIVGEPQ